MAREIVLFCFSIALSVIAIVLSGVSLGTVNSASFISRAPPPKATDPSFLVQNCNGLSPGQCSNLEDGFTLYCNDTYHLYQCFQNPSTNQYEWNSVGYLRSPGIITNQCPPPSSCSSDQENWLLFCDGTSLDSQRGDVYKCSGGTWNYFSNLLGSGNVTQSRSILVAKQPNLYIIFSTNQTVPFPNITLNTFSGTPYMNSTFTVPSGGTYKISTNLHSGTSTAPTRVCLDVRVNSTTTYRLVTHTTTSFEFLNSYIVLDFNTGDQIQLTSVIDGFCTSFSYSPLGYQDTLIIEKLN